MKRNRKQKDFNVLFAGIIFVASICALLYFLCNMAQVVNTKKITEPETTNNLAQETKHELAPFFLFSEVYFEDEPEKIEQKTQEWDTPLNETELTALLEACEKGNIDPAIALGLIQCESGFYPYAINERSGCYGYCQLNPKYFPSDLSPVDNILAGIDYFAYQLERYDGDIKAALTAYNAGHDTGDRTYADQVIAASATFRE